MQSQGVGVAQILEHVAQNRQQQVADVPARSSSGGPPPPPPAAGALAIADEEPRRKKKVVLTPDEAFDRLLAKHERKEARRKKRSSPYDRGPAEPSGLPPAPPLPIEDRARPARPTPTIAPRTPAQKRKAEMQMGRTTKPPQPAVVERYDISEGDHLPPEPEPPQTNFHLGKKFAKSIA